MPRVMWSWLRLRKLRRNDAGRRDFETVSSPAANPLEHAILHLITHVAAFQPALNRSEAIRGAGERGTRSAEISGSFEIPSPCPSPHFSVVGRGNRPRVGWWK